MRSRGQLSRRATNTRIQHRAYSTETPTSIDSYIQDMFKPAQERAISEGKYAATNISIATSVAPPSEATMAAASIDELIDHLHTLRGREKLWNSTSSVDRHKRIVHIVRHLVVRRRQRLTPFFYECVADAMADPASSGLTLVALVKDMAQQGIEPTPAFLRGALESLAVHPNYAAMLEILELARADGGGGGGLPESSRQTVALALLRDEQYELAYDTLMELHGGGTTRVDHWVYDIFVLVLGRMGFVEEMMEALTARLSLAATQGVDALQLYALDVCSTAFHYPGTLAGWNSLVRSGKVNPSDGILENVLNTAAREADTAVAGEALDMLAQRARLQDYHYDSLIDAFILDGDLASAARLHCIMHTSGIPATKAAVKRLVTAAAAAANANENLSDELDAWLHSAAAENLLVPPRIVHAAMESHMASSSAPSAPAMDLYRRYEQLCGEPWPSLDVMLQLLPHAAGDAETAAALCDRLVEELRAREDDESRDNIRQKFDGVVERLLREGKTAEASLFAEKLSKLPRKPQIEQPSS